MKIDTNTVVWSFITFILGVAVGVGGMTMTNRVRPAPIVIVPPEPTPLPEPTATPGPIRVFVSGQVAAPAVYELPPASIVQQAVEAAGGFTETANTAIVNLAQTLVDGAHVYVPAEGEETVAAPMAVVNQPATAVESSSAESPLAAAGSADGLVNINTATLEQLDTLPGVGPAIAQRIIDHRDANGPFATIEAVMDVSGIGEGRFEQMKDLITVGE
ncbi:MAG TPA: helix-hairpin-helix domain-containing protein [Anaerolineae bacterium]